MSDGAAQMKNTATSYHHTDFEDDLDALPDLRITISNIRNNNNNNGVVRKPSTIGDFLTDTIKCKEGNLCPNFGTHKCHCFKTEKDAESVVWVGDWRRPEAFEIPDSTDEESVKEPTKGKDPKFDWVISSIAHRCRDCKGVHFVPDDKEEDMESKRESITTTNTYPKTEQGSDIFDTATEALSSGSDVPLVIDERASPDVHEEAFVTPMEFAESENNFHFVTPDVILVEEVITIKDEPKEEDQDQADQTIKNEDPLEINDEEKPLFTYGDLFYPTFYPKKRWY